MGDAIARLSQKVDGVVSLAGVRIFVPAHTRQQGGKVVNVDGYWKTITGLKDLSSDERRAIDTNVASKQKLNSEFLRQQPSSRLQTGATKEQYPKGSEVMVKTPGTGLAERGKVIKSLGKGQFEVEITPSTSFEKPSRRTVSVRSLSKPPEKSSSPANYTTEKRRAEIARRRAIEAKKGVPDNTSFDKKVRKNLEKPNPDLQGDLMKSIASKSPPKFKKGQTVSYRTQGEKGGGGSDTWRTGTIVEVNPAGSGPRSAIRVDHSYRIKDSSGLVYDIPEDEFLVKATPKGPTPAEGLAPRFRSFVDAAVEAQQAKAAKKKPKKK